MIRRALVGVLAAAAVIGVSEPVFAAPGPPRAPEWWFDSWHVPALWRAGARGQGVTIAEIDTGVNAALPELSGRVLRGMDFGMQGGDGQIDHAVDKFGHGTAMASIMVARPGAYGITGLAPSARVLPIAVPLRGTTDAEAASGDDLAEAIRWAVNHGGKILSMSLGGSRTPSRDKVPCPADEQAAISYAIDKGAIVVAASGNSGDKGNPVEEPGVCLGVVSVGAVNESGTVARFSSRHPYLTVTAPGVKVPSLGRIPGQAFSGDGTSQATAITSAALALIWSKYPNETGRHIVTRLLATLDRHVTRPDPAYGYGIVNPYRAITTNVPAGAPNPVYDALAPFRASAGHVAALAPPKPAATRQAPPGKLTIGTAPGPVSTRVWIGGLAGLVGLIALVTLTIIGVRRSRRFAAQPSEWQYATWTPVGVPAPTYRDETGLLWHDLTARDVPPDPNAGGRQI